MSAAEIIADLVQYGPLTVAFDVYDNFFTYNKTTVYNAPNGSYVGGHAVKLIGYGTSTDGQDYWLLANSWGSNWGQKGYFKFLRGQNLCGIEDWATAVYTKSQPLARRSVEERQKRQGDNDAPVYPPGSFVPQNDLESDLMINAANAAAELIYNSNRRRQTAASPVVQSAFTNVVAGINYDMNMVLDGSIYHILMYQNLEGVYSFTAPPQVIGTVASGSGGLSGGDIAAIVACSVFGAALVVAAGVYLATRKSDSSSDGKPESTGVAEAPKGRFGIPVMNPVSHIRRVQAGEHQSATARSSPQ